MKRTLLISIIVVSFLACKKADNVVKPVIVPTVLGAWTNDNASEKKPTFTKDTLYWSDGSYQLYDISGDTLYEVYKNGNSYPLWHYYVNAVNDTMILTPFNPINRTLTYWRK